MMLIAVRIHKICTRVSLTLFSVGGICVPDLLDAQAIFSPSRRWNITICVQLGLIIISSAFSLYELF
jgi:hypothetical protein